LIAAAIGGNDPRFDLDGSRTINQRDRDLAFYALGQKRKAFYFSWKPEDDQIGSFVLKITVTDEHGDSSEVPVTLEVVAPVETGRD
jgi:hypothetical protein